MWRIITALILIIALAFLYAKYVRSEAAELDTEQITIIATTPLTLENCQTTIHGLEKALEECKLNK